MRWPAGAVVYEIDQPQVMGFQTNALADLGAAPAAERRRLLSTGRKVDTESNGDRLIAGRPFSFPGR
jgi:hypothetical protein